MKTISVEEYEPFGDEWKKEILEKYRKFRIKIFTITKRPAIKLVFLICDYIVWD